MCGPIEGYRMRYTRLYCNTLVITLFHCPLVRLDDGRPTLQFQHYGYTKGKAFFKNMRVAHAR